MTASTTTTKTRKRKRFQKYFWPKNTHKYLILYAYYMVASNNVVRKSFWTFAWHKCQDQTLTYILLVVSESNALLFLCQFFPLFFFFFVDVFRHLHALIISFQTASINYGLYLYLAFRLSYRYNPYIWYIYKCEYGSGLSFTHAHKQLLTITWNHIWLGFFFLLYSVWRKYRRYKSFTCWSYSRSSCYQSTFGALSERTYLRRLLVTFFGPKQRCRHNLKCQWVIKVIRN